MQLAVSMKFHAEIEKSIHFKFGFTRDDPPEIYIYPCYEYKIYIH